MGDEKQIKQEIRDVIRQITASVTFLPLLDCICSFDILIYTHKDLVAPDTWGESDACIIENSEEVKLRSFSTNIHRYVWMEYYCRTVFHSFQDAGMILISRTLPSA